MTTLTRMAAAGVGLLIILPAIIFGGTIGVEIVVAVAMLLALDEFARMAFKDAHNKALVWLVVGSAMLFGAGLYLGDAWIGLALALVVMGSLTVATMTPVDDVKDAAAAAGRYVVGITWIGGLITFLPMLRRLEDGLWWVFVVLVLPWAGDTGAYFAGRTFGKRKLFPRISPKKTWEGFFGGIAAAVAGALVIMAVGHPTLNVLDCLILGVGLGSAAVVGDLSESMLKRAFEVKDSGWILPGHGGILDRIDSLLFVGPLLYGYIVLIKGF